MATQKIILAGIFATLAALIPGVAAQCANLNPASGAAQMAAGYQSKVLMNGLKTPRGIIFDTEGNLLIAEQGNAGIRYVKLQDNGGINVCVASQKQLIPNGALNHGIALSRDGRTLFASSAVGVFAYAYDPVAGTVGTARQLVNIPRQGGGHQTRTLLVPRSNPNVVLVTCGSDPNLDMPTAEASSGRSQIRAFNVAGTSAVAYNTGELVGFGLRNSVGLTENPADGGVWSVENSLDNMARDGRDIHIDNPGEELNYHGVMNDTSNKLKGANYGYPHCFAIWDTAGAAGVSGAQVGQQMIQGTASGRFTDSYCQTTPIAPRLTFPAHTAPLDVKFKPDGSAAFVSFHGSWNRNPPDGYRVSRIAFANGQPVDPSTSKTAEVKIMWNANNGACPGRCFRPVGLAFDKANRLYVLSDSTGELFVVTGA